MLVNASRSRRWRRSAMPAGLPPVPLALEGAHNVTIDGTERRRQHPTSMPRSNRSSTAAEKTHTDKHLLVNEHTTQSSIWGRLWPGKSTTRKRPMKEIAPYRTNATLDKDTGFQGYEPAGVLTQQPKKPKAGVERSRQVPSNHLHLQCTRGHENVIARGDNGVGFLSKMSCA